jgi:Zn-dependent protease
VRSLIFFVIIIGSVLAHELAHAFAARSLGVPVRHIALTWFGGYAAFWVEPTRWRNAAIAFAGPALNLAIGAAFYVATKDLPDPNALELSTSSNVEGYIHLVASRPRELLIVEEAVRDIAFVNLSLGLFNLLPAFPLDGGHILRTLLSTQMSWGRAGWIAAWLGVILAAVGVAFAVWIESFTLFFLGAFVGLNAWMERAAIRYD